MPIKDNAYNSAREILINAGSKSAEKSHVKHTNGKDSPDAHGHSLLNEALLEFRAADASSQNLIDGLTIDHKAALDKAAKKMGLEIDYTVLNSVLSSNFSPLGHVVLLDELVANYKVQKKENNFLFASSAENEEQDDLFSMIQDSKKAGSLTNIAVVDSEGDATSGGKPTQDALKIYGDMLTLSSLANVVAMKGVYKEHPAKFNLDNPKEASNFVKAHVTNLNDTFTRRLGAYAIPSETTAYSYDKVVGSAELHVDFLNELFSSFSFSPEALKKLDGILTKVKDSLANLKVGLDKESETLDHMLLVNYIDPTKIDGIEDKILIGKIRMFYLKIERSSWEVSIGKSKIEKFKFAMQYFDTTLQINSDLVRTDTPTIMEVIKNFTGQEFEEMKKMTSPTVVQK